MRTGFDMIEATERALRSKTTLLGGARYNSETVQLHVTYVYIMLLWYQREREITKPYNGCKV